VIHVGLFKRRSKDLFTLPEPGRSASLVAEIAAIEMARKTIERAGAGDGVGLLFRDLTRAEIVAGDVVRTL